jgi:hypothetical protein
MLLTSRAPSVLGAPPAPAGLPGGAQRPQAIEYSDAYYTRLTIHRLGSYAMLPLFAGEYWLGNRLMQSGDVPSWVKGAHGVVAGTVGALFISNTVTGVWNLLESRKDPAGRTRRLLHSALMIASDAGFAITAAMGGEAGEDGFESGGEGDDASAHRTVAISSMAIAGAGTLLMWLWKD